MFGSPDSGDGEPTSEKVVRLRPEVFADTVQRV
jgi:hypothetical protein